MACRTAPSHYLNQCWNIVKWIIGNKLQWNFNRNSDIFIQENAFESIVCEMTAILSRPQCVNIKMPPHQCRNPHVKDKTVKRPTVSSLTWESVYLERWYLYWDGGPGVGVTKAPFVKFSVRKISISQKYMLDSSNHIHIWQVSPQLSCGDTCQI